MKAYEILAKTNNLTKEEWLQHRKGGIGGSDVSILCGISKYKSPIQLWVDKTTKEVDVSEVSEAAYWGNTLEDVVAKEFTKRTGIKVKNFNAILKSKEYEFMYANIDRMIVGENAFLECKTTSVYSASQWDDDKIPDGYMLQIQHYMYVLGCEYCYVAALIGGQRFVYKRIERDNDMIASIIDLEKDFWLKVQTNVPPMLDGSEAATTFMNSLYKEHEGKITLNSDNETWIEKYNELKSKEKELEEEINLCLNHLKQEIGEAKEGNVGEWVCRWTESNRTSLDTKKIKQEMPELYEKYGKSSVVKRFEIKHI